MSNIKELILTVTNRCNHSCKMCYYRASINKKIKELTLKEFGKTSANLGKIEHLMIAGGEPFLRKDLPGICKIFYENNGIRSLFIPTNGSVPETATVIKKIFKIMPDIRLNIMLSLEGREKAHDHIHGRTGAFKAVLRTIDELNNLRLEMLKGKRFFGLHLNTVVTNKNINEIIPLMDFIKNNTRVDFHAFSPMRGNAGVRGYKAPAGKLFNKLFLDAQPYLKFYAGKWKKGQRSIIGRINSRYRLWVRLLEGGRLPFRCRAGDSIGVIEPDGGVRLCELTPLIGNLRKSGYDFNKLWFLEKAGQMRKKIKNCACTHACFISASQRYR